MEKSTFYQGLYDAGVWLTNYGGDKLKEEVRSRILKRLGLDACYKIFTADFPEAKLAGYVFGGMKQGYFYGYYEMYCNAKLNPYNPKNPDQISQYAEYLLYSSSGSGIPGYKYALTPEMMVGLKQHS